MLPLYEWNIKEAPPEGAVALAQALNMPAAAACLLADRGLRDKETAERFLNPSLGDLGQPLDFPDVARAAQRLWQAIDAGELIAVFGDFDADGVTATALLTSALEAFGANVTAFIPDRLQEGFGLSPAALQRFLAAHGTARLVVTVDCGSNAAVALAQLRDSGIEVIVTDHHVPDPAATAYAYAFVNPYLPDTPAACRTLCGAGVAFKLACGVWVLGKERGHAAALSWHPQSWLDAVAVATVADVTPLTGENRILVHAGLKRLQSQPSAGLKALWRRACSDAGPLTSYHLAFILGPRLNAAGRMRNADPALELLRTSDGTRAQELAIMLEHLNVERRQKEDEIVAEAQAQRKSSPQASAVVVGGRGWHPGAVGIVASRLHEQTGVPAAVVSLDASAGGRGSLRAGRGYDGLAALQACAELLEGFGGHHLAAGFTLKPGNFDAFREAFNAACAAQQPAGARRPELAIDGWLTPGELTPALCAAVQRLEPFGEGNARPRWALRNVCLAKSPTPVGSAGAHLALQFNCAGRTVRGIWFRAAEILEKITPAAAASFDVAFECRLNRYNGTETVEMQVADMRLSATDKTDAPG